MTQEFHLSITPIRSDEYLVRTEEVAPGVPLAEEQYVWPTDEWLEQARQLMNDPIVGLLQGDRLSSLDNSTTVAQGQAQAASTLTVLGQQLYSHLFQGRLRDSWMTAQGIAQHRGEALRLRLGLKGNLLPGLPWEVLNGGVSEGFHISSQHVATGVNILFSRYLADAGMGNALGYQAIPKPEQTIKILMAIAAPTDQQQLKLNQEAHHLQEELRLKANVLKAGGAHLLPDIRVTILEQPGREELAQALEQGQFNIFHYAGHSELGDSGGKIYLVNRQTGLSETLSGNDLAGLLLNNDIQMAVLNSCRGSQTATAASDARQPGGTLTDALVNRGIPAVLAMAEQIPDDVALSLTRLFYRNLKQGYPVDLSLSRARQGLLSAYSSDQLYWALPTLYLHPDFDGYLTAGDRSLENPADSLIRLPHLHASPLTDAIASVTPDQDYEQHPGEAIAQNVTESVFPSSSSASLGHPPLTHSHQESEESFADTHADIANTEHLGVLEPQDAPVLGENPDLPDDFFLADHDLQGFDGDDDNGFDVADNVRNLVEQLEGNQSISEENVPANADHGARSQQDSETTSGLEEQDISLNYESQIHDGFYPPDDTESEGSYDLSMVTSEQDTDSSHPANEDDDSTPIPHGLLPSSTVSDDEATSALDRMDPENDLHTDGQEDASVDPVLLRQRQSSPWKKLVWLPIASVAGAAIVFLGYKFIPNVTTLSSDPQEAPVLRDDINRSNLTEKSTQRVSEFGIASFSVNNFDDGQAAIIELLNREELDQANAVLDSVPQEQLSNPNIIFLQGRLAWEYSDQNNPKYTVKEASEFWSYAAQKADNTPDAPLYYNALGFALYTEGQFEEAIDAWEQALVTIGEGGVSILPDVDGQAIPSSSTDGMNRVGVPQRPLTNQDALTAYSGIALAMTQLSAKPSVEQPYELVQQALQIRQIVTQSPAGLEPDTSEHAWLWTDALAQEWRFFKQISPQ